MEKIWERLLYSLDDPNSIHCLTRIVNNAETLSAYYEADGILTEANYSLKNLLRSHKKLDLSIHNREIDNILVFVFLKSLTTIPVKTKAYKLGLIDKNGRLIKDPVTKEENNAISNLDLLMFKIREWLRPKMYYLSSANWLTSIYKNQRVQNYLLNTHTLSKQHLIRKINNELDDILRKH